jgi:APA family basic amino acid/polyamine antiporter
MANVPDQSDGRSLKRALGLFEATAGGVGIILGAGIYVLIGEVAADAGNEIWISFLIAAVMAGTIGLAYAELVSMFPRAGADYEYTRHALGPRAAFVVGWLIVIGAIVASAAVALGFGRYLNVFWDIAPTRIAMGSLVVATLIAWFGIKEAVWVSIVLTIVEAAGLVFIIVIGVPHFGDVNLLENPHGTAGIFSGAALAMFAFVGFEDMVALAEETRDAKRVIPRALLLAIAITGTFYLVVALASISILGWEQLSGSEAPLAAVAEEVFGGRAADYLAIVALFSTGNTLLLLLVTASRLIYGMASTTALPRFLAWIHPGRQTPARAIVLSLIVALGFTASGDIAFVAGATNFAVFVGFMAVNLSLIVLRYTRPDAPRNFRVPVSIGRLPLIPVFALASVVFLMVNLELDVLLVGGALLLSGIVAMEVFSLWKPEERDETVA